MEIRSASIAILLGWVGFGGVAYGTDHSWTYDFKTGTLATDWNFNTNNPSVVGLESDATSSNEVARIIKKGSTVFQSAAIHEDEYSLSVGDRLTISLAWSPHATAPASGSNNEVFQLGALNLDEAWADSEDRFPSGDGIWLSGREISSTAAPGPDVWGTETIDLWINTENDSILASSMTNYLGRHTVNSLRQGSDGSVSVNYLAIELDLEILAGGDVSYGVGINEWVRTQSFFVGSASWADQGNLMTASGTRSHNLDAMDALHPAFGYVVSNSLNEGIAASYWSNTPAAVPEPGATCLLGLSLGLLARRRRG